MLLLEKAALTAGCTWHAAGLVGQLRSKRNLTRLMQYSAELYDELEAETGQAIGWKRSAACGSPPREERWSEIKRMATTARSFGFELHRCRPTRRRSKFPLIDPTGVAARRSSPATATSTRPA